MILSALVLSPTVVLSENRTQFASTYNFSFPLPYSIFGFVGTLGISFGTFSCNSLNLISSTTISNSTCNNNNLIFNSNSILTAGIFWISFNILNYFSTRNNSLSIALTSPFPNLYQIATGSTHFTLTINNHSFTLNNSITTFAAKTTFTLVESSSLSIDATLNRIVTI